MIKISFESTDFPASTTVPNGKTELSTSWDDLLWSAVTVGRPNRAFVFKHGLASWYEAQFRWSLVRMALEQSGPAGYRLRRTDAAKTLDPTEKGAVNYFLGLAVCKLFADRVLNVPWMLHLDVFRKQLNAQLKGRSRPDLLGQDLDGNWIVLECKGRASHPSDSAIAKAKLQAQRILSINGVLPNLRIGGFVFYRDDVLQFSWIDPPDEPRISNEMNVVVEPDDWQLCYRPLLDLVRSHPSIYERMREVPTWMRVPELDLEFSLHPEVIRATEGGRLRVAEMTSSVDVGELPYHRDGVAVRAGGSWGRPFEEQELTRGDG